MKPITFFHLPYCPHCLRARQIMADLIRDYPEFGAIPLREVDESRESKLADAYDYYLVPAFYVGDEKLHEGVPSKQSLLNVFRTALG